MENGVKANVLKIGDGFHFAQVMAITLTQTKDRAAGAEHLLPKMRERMGRPLRVHLNHFDRLAVLRMRLANPGEGEKRAQHAYVKEHWFHARFHHEKDSASVATRSRQASARFSFSTRTQTILQVQPRVPQDSKPRVLSRIGWRTRQAESSEDLAGALR